jgi:type III secretion protein O
MSVFKELLAIKRFREGQAEVAVARERNALQEARRAREEAEALLARMREEGEATEHRLYRELCERIVRLRDIESVQQSVADLRRREAEQEDATGRAAMAQDAAARLLQTARDAHRDASRQTSKFVDLAQAYAEAQSRESERKEDMEMEEAASVVRDREDWESHDKDASP